MWKKYLVWKITCGNFTPLAPSIFEYIMKILNNILKKKNTLSNISTGLGIQRVLMNISFYQIRGSFSKIINK